MLSKATRFLGRKTKRSKILFEEKDIPKTIIRLIYLSSKKNQKNNNDYTYIKFSFSKKISLKELPKINIQKEEFNIKSEKIWITDKIELGNGKERINFNVTIYINKENTFYIDLTPKIKGYYFEFIFYSKTLKELPKFITSQYGKKLEKFDNYGLKYRKKISIINTDTTVAIDYIHDLNLGDNSYKICVRIKKDGSKSTAIHEIELEKKITIQKTQMKANIDDIIKIIQLFKDIQDNSSFAHIHKTFNNLSMNNIHDFLKEYTYTNKIYSDIPDIDDNDANLFKEHLLKLIISYFSLDDEKNYIENKNNIIRIIENIKEIMKDIEIFAKNSENRPLFRFRLYRATFNNIYSIIKKLPTNQIKILELIMNYNQKIIDLKNIENDNPYHKAINFLKLIAQNLDEKSCIFDMLMQYNSGISRDIILSHEKGDKNRRDITKYELSLLTVDEVKNHLIKILPDFIIRYTFDNDIYAFYNFYNDIIFVNEKKTFKTYNIISKYNSGGYTVPIVMLLIHECWGHTKVCLSSKGRNSPTHCSFRNEDFNETILEIPYGKKKNKIKGESGFEIEYMIAGERCIKNIYSNYLLSVYDSNNDNLLDVNLWIKANFKSLRNAILKNIKENSPEDITKYLNKNKEEEIDDGEGRQYIMESFFIDGVEIGPLFKI